MFRRRPKGPTPPDHLRKSKALVVTPLDGGDWLAVFTDQLRRADDGAATDSWDWTSMESAGWDGDRRTLTVRFVDGREPLKLVTATDDVFELVQAVRDRVHASMIHVEVMPTAAGGDVRAFIRRGPDGKLFSQLVARGVLSEEEEKEADELEARARSAVGMEEE